MQELSQKEITEIQEKEIIGFITREEMQKLKEISFKAQSPYRKKTYSKWICSKCEHTCYYQTLRCQMCAAPVIEKTKNTLYMLGIKSSEINLNEA